MKKKVIGLFVMVVVLICAIGGTVVINGSKSTTGNGNSSNRAAQFELKAVSGDKLKLSSLRGKVVVLNFFATWCPPCKAELPDFVKKADELKKNNSIKFVFVDVGESSSVVKAFLDKNKYSSINPLLDSDGKVSDKYSVTGIPTTYMIDKKGNIIMHHVGYMDMDTLKKAVDTALAE